MRSSGLAYLNGRNSMYFFLWGKVNTINVHVGRVMPLNIGAVWKALVQNDSRRATLVDTLYSFPWLLLLFFNFLALCCPFSLSPSPQALLICPLHCAWFGNCWSALCHRTWALELLWVKGMGFSTQTFIKTVLTTQRLFAYFLLFSFVVQNWDWQICGFL